MKNSHNLQHHLYKNYDYLDIKCDGSKHPDAPIFTRYREQEYAKAVVYDIEEYAYNYADMCIMLVSQNQNNEVIDVVLAHAPGM